MFYLKRNLSIWQSILRVCISVCLITYDDRHLTVPVTFFQNTTKVTANHVDSMKLKFWCRY